MGKFVSKIKALMGLDNNSVGTTLSTLLFLIVFQLFLFPSLTSAQFGLGAFWKKYVAPGGNPPNPTGLGATPADYSVDLTWTSGGGSTASFRIVWAEGASAPTDCTGLTSEMVTGISASPYTVSGLKDGIQYTFRICAVDGSSNLSSGATISSTTTSSSRYIFVTTLGYKGNAIPNCATLATAAGLPNGGNYVSMLAGGGVGWVQSTFGVKLPIKNRNPGGFQVVATSRLQGALDASIAYSQVNVAVTGDIWTGAETDGTSSATACVSTFPWNSGSGGVSGKKGLSTDVTATWFSTGTSTCGTSNKIVCVDGTNGTVPPPDTTGVTVTPTSGTAVTVSWTNNGAETIGNNLVLKLTSEGALELNCAAGLGTELPYSVTGATSTSYYTGLTAGATYHVRVCAVDEDNKISEGKVVQFTMPSPTILWLGTTISTTGISSTGFTANLGFSGDSDNDFTATLYYCNATLNAGCNPENTGTGYGSASMSKSGGNLTAIISGLAPATWNEYDVLNLRVVASDPDTAYGSPVNGTVTLLNVIQPPTTFVQKIKAKAADLSGSYPYAYTTIDPDLFGYKIAKYGRIMVVGTVQDDNNSTTISTTADSNDGAVDSGAAWILRDTSAGGDWTSYVIDKFLKQPDVAPATNAIFGRAVAFDGTTIAISAPSQSANNVAGKVFTYREASVNGNWSDVTHKDTITDPKWSTGTYDNFGFALAVSGRNLFVGDQGDDGKDETAGSEVATLIAESGAVSVYYDATGDGTGYPASTPDKKLKQRNDSNALNVIANTAFGASIAYSGSTLAVGAPGRAGTSVAGKAFAYSCKITASGNPCGPTINWAAGTNTITAKVLTTTSPMNVPDTGLTEQFYGQSISIDDDAIVVGAPSDQTPNEADNAGTSVTNAGAAYLWHSTNGNADWSTVTMVKKLKRRNGSGTVTNVTGCKFGTGVAVLGPVVAVGGPSCTADQQVNVFKDSDGDANYSTGSLGHHQTIGPPASWSSTQADLFGENVLLDNSTGVFHLTISHRNESSQNPTSDSNPGSGSSGYQSGAVSVYGP